MYINILLRRNVYIFFHTFRRWKKLESLMTQPTNRTLVKYRGGDYLVFHAEREIVPQEEIMNCYGLQAMVSWKMGDESGVCKEIPGVGFKCFFISPRHWGNDPIWLLYFSNGLKQPPRTFCKALWLWRCTIDFDWKKTEKQTIKAEVFEIF